MRKQFDFSEEELYLAAREAEQFIRAQYPDAQTCPPHTFSPAFEADMQQLFVQLQTGTLKPSAARLGWPYYLRRSIAAILLCFLLACATMPEAVLAGYQKLIEVVEHVFEECIEFRYKSNSSNNMKFKPLELEYLPEGMELTRKDMTYDSIDLVYQDKNDFYFRIYQKLIAENYFITYKVDVGYNLIGYIDINGDKIKITQKEDELYFMGICTDYYIMGQTNLTKEDIENIFMHIEF